MTQKTLNACRKWYRHSMKFSKPFLESPNPPLLTAKRYKGWQMSLYPSSLIQKVNFVSSLFTDHQHFWPWLYVRRIAQIGRQDREWSHGTWLCAAVVVAITYTASWRASTTPATCSPPIPTPFRHNVNTKRGTVLTKIDTLLRWKWSYCVCKNVRCRG